MKQWNVLWLVLPLLALAASCQQKAPEGQKKASPTPVPEIAQPQAVTSAATATPSPATSPEPQGAAPAEPGTRQPASIRFSEGFESEADANPRFSRTATEAFSGKYSLELKAPGDDGKTGAMFGGDIAETRIPSGVVACEVSLQTLLKDLPAGRLMLRVVFFDGQGEKIASAVLSDVTAPEATWTEHSMENSLTELSGSAASMRVWVALDSQSSEAARGWALFDDVKIDFRP